MYFYLFTKNKKIFIYNNFFQFLKNIKTNKNIQIFEIQNLSLLFLFGNPSTNLNKLKQNTNNGTRKLIYQFKKKAKTK